MKSSTLRVGLAIMAILSAPLTAGAGPVKPVAFPHEQSSRIPDPEARYGRLSNGMSYIIQANDTPTGTAAIYLRVAAGSLVETDKQKGLAHFVEHMAFNGTTNISEGELRRRLERHGFAFGADSNAFTFDIKTLYMLHAPKSDDDTIDEALFILREIASNVRFDPAAVDRERGVILSEERLRSDASARRGDKWVRQLYAGARYADYFNPIGTVDSIKSAPASELKAYYDTWYRPELTTLIVVGDFDAFEIEAMVNAKFSDWRGKGPMPEEPDWGSRASVGVQTFAYTDKGLNEELGVSWIAPPETRGDTPDRISDILMDNHLFQIANTRLKTRALAGDAAFFSASLGSYPVPHTAGVVYLSVFPRPGRAKEAFAQAYGVIHTLRAQGVTKEELRKAQQVVDANVHYLQASKATRDSTGIAGMLVNGLDLGLVTEGPDEAIRLQKASRKDIGTKQKMDARLKSWFAADGPVLSHSGESLNGYDEAAMRADYDALTGADAATYAAAKSKSWPYGRLFTPKVQPASVTYDKDFEYSRYVWPNGVTLHIKPTQLVANHISVQVDFSGGQVMFDPAKRPPLFLTSGDFLYWGGLNKLSMTEQDDALRNYQVGVNYSLGGDRATLSGTTNASSLSHEMELLFAYATDAAYRPDPFDRYAAWAPEYLRTLKATPEGVRTHNWGRIMYNGDARFDEVRLNGMDGIDHATIRDLLKTSLSNTPIHITIVGDVDERKAVTEVGKTFGALPIRPTKAMVADGARTISYPPKQREVTLSHEGRADQAMSMALWPTDDFLSDPKASRIETVLAVVMSNRLQDELRESQGADYAPSAYAFNDEVYDGLGGIGVVSAIRAGGDGDFRKALGGIVADLKAKPVSDDELDRARKPILASMTNEVTMIEYWTYVLSRMALQPEMRSDWLGRRKQYEDMTPKDLQDAAQRYLKDDTVISIRIEPAK
jgi:zinc protease